MEIIHREVFYKNHAIKSTLPDVFSDTYVLKRLLILNQEILSVNQNIIINPCKIEMTLIICIE